VQESVAGEGPQVSASHRDRINGFVTRARQTRPVLAGGEAAEGAGFFYRPTIVDQVSVSDELFQEEVFGPVLAITRFRTPDEAVLLANATRFGLCAGIWTADEDRARAVAADLDVGTCWINSYWSSPPNLSRTARRESGLGALDFGVEGLREYLTFKQVAFRPA